MELIFLGRSVCIPKQKNDEPACFIVNRKYLVDFGYKSVLALADIGIDPNDVQHCFVTHCHQDHILGMPLFLFYKMEGFGTSADIYGPVEEITDTVERAKSMAMMDRYYADKLQPVVHELKGNESFDIDELHVECCPSDHAIPGICYKFTIDGKTLGILGDSRYSDDIADFFKGCDAVVHETAHGVGEPVHERFVSGHSCAYDALKTAERSGTKKLFIVHNFDKNIPSVMDFFQQKYDGEAIYPELFKPYYI